MRGSARGAAACRRGGDTLPLTLGRRWLQQPVAQLVQLVKVIGCPGLVPQQKFGLQGRATHSSLQAAVLTSKQRTWRGEIELTVKAL